MKRTFEIENAPGKVNVILHSFAKDPHLSKTFEGTVKNGRLSGYYTNLALINGMVIGYVKITGQYDRKSGDLRIAVVPGNLYWIVIAFNIFAMSFLAYKGINGDKLLLTGFFIFLVMAAAVTGAFLLESSSFIKHLQRMLKLSDKSKT